MKRCKTCGKRIWFSGISTRVLPKGFDLDAPNVLERYIKLNIPYSHYHNNKKCYPDYQLMKVVEKIYKKYGGNIDKINIKANGVIEDI